MTNQGSGPIRSDICILNNINQCDLDVDFSKYSVEEFIKEIMKLKN